MADALSDNTIDIVKATIPALEKGGTAVTDRMYQILFTNSEIRDLFNQSHHGKTGSQSKALTAAVIGGGSRAIHPGAVSRAHHGVLFLDESPEFRRDVLDALRQPLESAEVVISLRRGSSLPALAPAGSSLFQVGYSA